MLVKSPSRSRLRLPFLSVAAAATVSPFAFLLRNQRYLRGLSLHQQRYVPHRPHRRHLILLQPQVQGVSAPRRRPRRRPWPSSVPPPRTSALRRIPVPGWPATAAEQPVSLPEEPLPVGEVGLHGAADGGHVRLEADRQAPNQTHKQGADDPPRSIDPLTMSLTDNPFLKSSSSIKSCNPIQFRTRARCATLCSFPLYP